MTRRRPGGRVLDTALTWGTSPRHGAVLFAAEARDLGLEGARSWGEDGSRLAEEGDRALLGGRDGKARRERGPCRPARVTDGGILTNAEGYAVPTADDEKKNADRINSGFCVN